MIHYLRLIRFPLIFTAIADSWAGYLISLPAPFLDLQLSLLTLLAAVSACLYAAGMVFNDVADAGRDARIHPERVIPSGRVKLGRAVLLGLLLSIAALASSFCISFTTLLIAFAIVLLAFLYNNLLKRYRIAGSFAMGLIRGGNFLLGMSAFAQFQRMETALFVFPSILAVYVFMLTMISTLEEGESRRELFMTLTLCLALSVVGVNAFLARAHAALFLSLLTATGLVGEAILLMKNFSPASVKEMVRVAIVAIIPLDAIMVVGQGSPRESLIVFALILPLLIAFGAMRRAPLDA
ncbi:MAG: hypothetical protein A2Z34_05195 [Planctomycetes bacterium RBG_16_59_8]|nr:MAG: hypothetical protein A2Z34_05195 [Planctomycetes bacterium RBG_16_59_8]